MQDCLTSIEIIRIKRLFGRLLGRLGLALCRSILASGFVGCGA
jgi:hypothetical protein